MRPKCVIYSHVFVIGRRILNNLLTIFGEGEAGRLWRTLLRKKNCVLCNNEYDSTDYFSRQNWQEEEEEDCVYGRQD
jgi:hypothetical protein